MDFSLAVCHLSFLSSPNPQMWYGCEAAVKSRAFGWQLLIMSKLLQSFSHFKLLYFKQTSPDWNVSLRVCGFLSTASMALYSKLINHQWHHYLMDFYCCFSPKMAFSVFFFIHMYPVRVFFIRQRPLSGLVTYSLAPPHFYYVTVSGSITWPLCLQQKEQEQVLHQASRYIQGICFHQPLISLFRTFFQFFLTYFDF